jgi:hypothetical protein
MKGSFFQRHLVHDAWASEKSWEEQVALEAKSTPENAEFEPWVQDLSPKPLELVEPRYKGGVWVEDGYDANGYASGLNGHANSVNGHASGVNGHANGLNGHTTDADLENETLPKKRMANAIH